MPFNKQNRHASQADHILCCEIKSHSLPHYSKYVSFLQTRTWLKLGKVVYFMPTFRFFQPSFLKFFDKNFVKIIPSCANLNLNPNGNFNYNLHGCFIAIVTYFSSSLFRLELNKVGTQTSYSSQFNSDDCTTYVELFILGWTNPKFNCFVFSFNLVHTEYKLNFPAFMPTKNKSSFLTRVQTELKSRFLTLV